MAVAGCGARTGLGVVGTTGEGGVLDGGTIGSDGAAGGPTEILLFGGSYHPTPTTVDYLSDTWTYDGSRWTNHNGAAPLPRACAAAATLGKTTLLFGGGSSDPHANGGVFGDTWTWDAARWVRQNVPGPTARDGAAMAAVGNTIVLFGGGGIAGELGDTWTWDGAQWTEHQMPGPPPRIAAVAATLGDRVVLYGGQTNRGITILDDTWTWDGVEWTQVQVPGPGSQLSDTRDMLGCVAATLGSNVVLFCNLQTWTFDGTGWKQQGAAPPKATYPFLAYPGMSRAGSALILFGGYDGVEDTGGTWTWNGMGNWAQENVTGPSPRNCPAMASR